MYHFEEQIEKQKVYYEAFKQWLMSRMDYMKCKDADPKSDLAGIDLIVTDFEGIEYNVQVKTDFKTDATGNLVAEIISQARYDKKAKLGWLFDLWVVDFLAYISAPSGSIRIFDAHKFFNFVLEHYRDFDNFTARNSDYITLGLLIPVKKIEDIIEIEGRLDDIRYLVLNERA